MSQQEDAVQTIAVPGAALVQDDSGGLRIRGTRVLLDDVVASFLSGATAEDIADQYPTVSLADVYALIAYYLRQRSAIDEYLKRRTAQADELQAEMEKRFDPAGVRARLLARRSATAAA